MSKVDWSKAPEGAEFYAGGYFYKISNDAILRYDDDDAAAAEWVPSRCSIMERESCRDYEKKPKEWPTETGISAIAQNGGTGEHYSIAEEVRRLHDNYEAAAPIGKTQESASDLKLKDAGDFLSAGMTILCERGQQYGSNSRECSFPQVAEAFNAITGNELSGSDVCMILALLKLVRQSAQRDRLHVDSLVDGVNYMALYAEMISKELNK